jgi:hypothetical protein
MERVVRLLLLPLVAATLAQPARAQKRLVLQTAEDRQDKYNVILRKVFKRIYGNDVVLSVLCVPSFVPEEAAGILKTPQGYKAFALTPSASTWSTEYHRFIKEVDAHGKEIPFDQSKNTKKGLPTSYHGIKTRLQSRPLPADLAERIKQLWQAKLLEALRPPPETNEERKDKERVIVLDGVSYYYAMSVQGHGLVTAEGQPANGNTTVWLMGEFSEALSAYAKGKASEEELKKPLNRVERKRA